MRSRSRWLLWTWLWSLVIAAIGPTTSPAAMAAEPAAAGFQQPAADVLPNLYLWTDTSNVWILRDGDSALLIELGDGSVLEHLAEIGVKRVEWVLFADHHREGLQGHARIDHRVTQVAAPRAEETLFRTPTQFRRWQPLLGDPYTVHGSSYVRPPQQSVAVDRWLEDDEVFTWRGHSLRCLSTPGHSPGGMSYLLETGHHSCLFLGGLMSDGSRMTNWFDTEWDYGFAKGIDALTASVLKLTHHQPSIACSTAGPLIRNATEQLQRYVARLTEFRAAYIRGYPVQRLTKTERHPAVEPTAVPTIVRVTPHLYMFGPEMAGKNFAIIIADSGHALLLDCGLFSPATLAELIAGMQEHLGLKQIDACWISHMHGDHFTLAPALADRGIPLWTMDTIVDKCEHPRDYDYPALIASYGVGCDGAHIDRELHAGEVIDWEGYQLHIDWMPGQTEFANCLWLDLDGQRIAFTGDNLFGNPADPEQDGHECVVARNSALIEEGYLVAAKYLQELKPDVIMGAHSVLMTEPAAFVDRYRDWAERMIQLYRDLLPAGEYEYRYDPYWVHAYPYRVDLRSTEPQTVQLTVRNFRDTPQSHHVRLELPPGITATPAVLSGEVPAHSRTTFPVTLTVTDRDSVPAGVNIVPLEITLDHQRFGQLFDFMVLVSEPAAAASDEPRTK